MSQRKFRKEMKITFSTKLPKVQGTKILQDDYIIKDAFIAV